MILIDQRAPALGPAPENASAQAAATALDAHLGTLGNLEERIRAIRNAIAGRIAFSTSLGLEDQAVTHAIAQARNQPRDNATTDIAVFTLDTGRHFPETYDVLFETEGRYGLKIRVMYPDAKDVEDLVEVDGIYGFRYSLDARKACCDVRKVRPLNRALAGADAWITGLRREQSQGRAHVPFAIYDAVQKLIKLNPIADWSQAELDRYVIDNKIPTNALHKQGFPSIGCQPCTRAVQPREDMRAGRWWWENENGKECGLHSRSEPSENQ